MGIRNEKGRWTEEAIEFAEATRNALIPLFDEYKKQFTFEEMHYLVCATFNDIILDEILGLKPNSEYRKRIKE